MNRRRFIKSSAAYAATLTMPLAFAHCRQASKIVTHLTDFSALDLSKLIRDKEASCEEVMMAYLKHIHHFNPVYNAIVSMIDDDTLINQARKADQALARGEYWGWMHGMPHAIKDLAPVKGLVHTEGSPMFANRVATADSSLVEKIRNQGAIFIGKTNTPEFGLGSQTYNPVFGPTGNAFNPKLTSGGSSGGAACGLGTRMLPVADGGDMMGSLRNPGAFNNVIGFRPSTTVIMEDGDATDRLLWTSGPMGRNVRDTVQLLQTMSIKPIYNNLKSLDLKQIKVGWLGNLNNYLAMEPGIIELCENSLEILESAGVEVEPTHPKFEMSDLWQCWTTLRHATRENKLEYYENPATKNLLKPELIWEIEQSLTLNQDDIQAAAAIRKEWYVELERLFKKYDFLVLPSAQVFPFDKNLHWPKDINGRKMDTYHRWMEVVILASLGGIPAINVPVGFDAKERPMGMQIMGKFGDDQRVLEFALAYEQITDYLDKRPNLVSGEA